MKLGNVVHVTHIDMIYRHVIGIETTHTKKGLTRYLEKVIWWSGTVV